MQTAAMKELVPPLIVDSFAPALLTPPPHLMLLVTGLFHPVDHLTPELFLNSDVRHGSGRHGSVPVLLMMAQGRKRVDLGRTTFIYGESRYLLTSVDLPIVSQIIEASEEAPSLAMSLKLEMPVIRELLDRGDSRG
jgi:hypothetical protein